MPTKEQHIDRQWLAVAPKKWGNNRHKGERQMLYNIMDDDEEIKALVGGSYRAEQDTARKSLHRGVAVATEKRIIFLDKGVFGSTEVSEMPYRSVEGLTHSTGMVFGGVQVTGLGRAGWRIEDVDPKDSAKLFADSVRAIVEEYHARANQSAPETAAPVSEADELAKWAELKERGLITEDEFESKKRQILGI